MMKLGWLPRAAIVLIAPVLSMVAAAQSGAPAGQLDIPENIHFVGKQDPAIRKATAIVNGEVITGSDVDQRVALALANNNQQLSADDLERVRAQVLRNLIDETLEIQAAAQEDITIDAPELEAYYARVANNFHRTPQAFTAYLHSIGSSDRSLKRQIQGELAWERLKRRRIEPFVSVGDDEVQRVIARVLASRGTAEYHVAEIFMSATPETLNQVRANAANIVQQIRNGANFQAYARQFSEASTAALGGDLGWVRAEQLPEELAGVVQQMPVGAISEPIPVPGGVSIIVLADKRQIGVADPRDAMLSLIQMSVALPAGATRAQAEERGRQLGAATQAMGGCGHAPATAQSLGAEVVANDQVRVRDLPPALQQMLLGLGVGQATQPFGSQERLSVLVLCGRDDPPPVAAPNPDQIANQMEEERVARRAQRYLRDLRRDAVVDYR
jgi:peptidyl-prolyl cis-trans isomerase SurA